VRQQGGEVEEDGRGWGSWLLGLAIGVGAAMLMAPKAGSDTRRMLRQTAQRGRDYVSKGRESAGDLIERGRELIGRQKEEQPAFRDAPGARPNG